jgi:hypothetical protein
MDATRAIWVGRSKSIHTSKGRRGPGSLGSSATPKRAEDGAHENAQDVSGQLTVVGQCGSAENDCVLVPGWMPYGEGAPAPRRPRASGHRAVGYANRTEEHGNRGRRWKRRTTIGAPFQKKFETTPPEVTLLRN